MVDKPRRRLKANRPWEKIAAVTVAAVIIVSVGLYAYNTYIVKPNPLYAKIQVRLLNGNSLGGFEVELFPSNAPLTVANFVKLAQSGFYNNLTWHRIEKNFVIQIGDPSTLNGGGNRSKWGQGGSGVSIPFENSTLSNSLSSVAMASNGPGVGGASQFYINLNDNTQLDGKYAVFGMVISGMEVVQSIGNLPTEAVPLSGGGTQNEPVTPVLIASIIIQSVP